MDTRRPLSDVTVCTGVFFSTYKLKTTGYNLADYYAGLLCLLKTENLLKLYTQLGAVVIDQRLP